MRFALILLSLLVLAVEAKDYRGGQFIGFDRFDRFTTNKSDTGLVLVSPKIEAAILWDELIVSWNFRAPPQTALEVQAKAIYPSRETKWYSLGKWASEPTVYPRESVRGQKDDDGTVDTDILKLKEKTRAVLLRVTLRGTNAAAPLKFLGLAFCNSAEVREPLAAKKSAWGESLTVPERTQADYPDGINEWCSPTAVSMILGYWAGKLSRSELNYDVPDVARAVRDPNWPGTGNWPFNTAFAGWHEGIRGYVTRLSDVAELEQWMNAGVPVAVSVRYGHLKGLPQAGNGHLIVCIGFDEEGNAIVNDPGRRQVRQTYKRENLVKAWAGSENTVYLIYPETWKPPEDRFEHWR
jgi:hypothetical protein